MTDFEEVRGIVNRLLDKIADNAADAAALDSFLLAGDVQVSHNSVTEAVYLDESWISTVEQALFSVEQIVKDPKRSIVDADVLVGVEKARKINARSIQYLASHSEHVSNVVDGEVRPSKIMTTEYEEDLKTYENRFVYTLIDRLESYVRTRYEAVKAQLDVAKTDLINFRNTVKSRDITLDCEIRLTVRDAPRGSVQLEKNYELFRRIETLLKRVRVLKAGDFAAKLEGVKPIYPPIVKTNLILKNVDYNNAYKLWLYISAENYEAFRAEVERKILPFDAEYTDDLKKVAALLWSVTEADNRVRKSLFASIPPASKKSKRYRTTTRFDYEPTFGRAGKEVPPDAVNQYYFEEMKRLIGAETDSLRGGVLVEKKGVSAPFSRFFRATTRISDAIYADVLTVPAAKTTKKKRTRAETLKAEVQRQTEVLKRRKLLSRLMSEELTKTLNAEAKELVRLEKLKFELAVAEEKRADKKTAAKKRSVRLAAVKGKSKAALERAEAKRAELLDAESERQEQELEARREKFRKIQETRERKTLERLKAKYENDDEA